MDLLKAALEADPRAHTRPSGVKHLASLLGLKGRSNEVTMCIGQSALAQRNLEAAQQSCVQLIRREYVASWRLCAAVMRAGGDEIGSADTHTMLLSFAAQYARGKKVILLLPPLLLMLTLLRCSLCLCCQAQACNQLGLCTWHQAHPWKSSLSLWLCMQKNHAFLFVFPVIHSDLQKLQVQSSPAVAARCVGCHGNLQGVFTVTLACS